ncbi:hypothetical protein WKK05_22860 [Nostoc sp. UHCC 0302]|uniref:hypothetical protein n=1 Tax=Nostoc sp. UHCC 0302 TaxID=3134896 RepID=UPI00311C95C4
MFSKKTFWANLASLVLLAGTSGVAVAEMPSSPSDNPSQFQHIEQPLRMKVGVAIAGLTLIGLELWWFLLYKSPES